MTSLRCGSRRACPRSFRTTFLLIVAISPLGCGRAVSQPSLPSMELKSSTLTGDTIPGISACSRENCPCDGQNISPQLSWTSPPEHTNSFALIVTDKDSPFGLHFVHWVVYDLPPDKRELTQGIANQEQLPDGSRQGQNGFGKIGYVGPCPPGKSAHRYVFDLYALDTKLNLPPGSSKKQVVKAMQGHILGTGELIGKYQR
jgi:Raf kinase inhibitor-like YbhB/YbcL family protein